MSTLTEELLAHRWSPGPDSRRGGCYGCAFHGNYVEFVDHIIEAVGAAGLAVIQLPEPVTPPDHWAPDCIGAWPVVPDQDPVSAFTHDEVFDPNGERMTSRRARALAAALLAAADVAEKCEAVRLA